MQKDKIVTHPNSLDDAKHSFAKFLTGTREYQEISYFNRIKNNGYGYLDLKTFMAKGTLEVMELFLKKDLALSEFQEEIP